MPVPRTILYTGKGGVGKTSVAAATACRCAAAGLRTVVLSTDPAHSLADSLEAPVGPDPTLVADRLWGDRKSTRLNSSHVSISYVVFCLKKKIQMSSRLLSHWL